MEDYQNLKFLLDKVESLTERAVKAEIETLYCKAEMEKRDAESKAREDELIASVAESKAREAELTARVEELEKIAVQRPLAAHVDQINIDSNNIKHEKENDRRDETPATGDHNEE